MSIPDTLGGRIRWVREKRGYEPAWFAARVGMAASTLAGLENGSGQKTTTRLHAIVAELGTTSEFLEKGRGEWDARRKSKLGDQPLSQDVAQVQTVVGLLAAILTATIPAVGRTLLADLRDSGASFEKGTFYGNLADAVRAELPAEAGKHNVIELRPRKQP